MKIDRQLVENYNELDWERLLRADLGNAGQLSAAKPYFDRIKNTFDSILNNPITDSLSDDANQRVEVELNNFITFLQSEIVNFSDVSLRKQKLTAVQNKEWQIITNLNAVISYLVLNEEKVNIKDTELLLENAKKELDLERAKSKSQNENIASTFDKLSESIKLADSLESKSGVIKTAIIRAEEWISKNEDAVQLILKSNATDSAKKAEEHKTFKFEWVSIWLFKHIPYLQKIKQPAVEGTFFWILSAIISGTFVMSIIGFFVYLDYLGREINVASVLLRLSAVLIPAYFTFFSAQQYLSHRRLYEAYRFRDVTLQTMISLRDQSPDDTLAKEHILKKAVEVMFAEPKMSGEVKYDKQVVSQLLDLARNRLG